MSDAKRIRVKKLLLNPSLMGYVFVTSPVEHNVSAKQTNA
jgi:hypothetical protein